MDNKFGDLFLLKLCPIVTLFPVNLHPCFKSRVFLRKVLNPTTGGWSWNFPRGIRWEIPLIIPGWVARMLLSFWRSLTRLYSSVFIAAEMPTDFERTPKILRGCLLWFVITIDFMGKGLNLMRLCWGKFRWRLVMLDSLWAMLLESGIDLSEFLLLSLNRVWGANVNLG